MKTKFFTKIAAFLLLVALGVLAVLLLGYDSRLTPAVMRDKHARLEQIAAPRIIIVGGSNAAYGLDSPRLQREVGVPVVNMGLTAGLGLRYMLSEIRDQVQAGDVVVISPEYEQFIDEYDGNGGILSIALLYPKALTHISTINQVVEMLRYAPNFLNLTLYRGLSDRIVNPLLHTHIGDASTRFMRSDFNETGDLVGYLNRAPSSSFPVTSIESPEVDKASIAGVSEFAAFARSRGASVMLEFPPYNEKAYIANRDIIVRIAAALHGIDNLRVANTPQSNIFPTTVLFDSNYHVFGPGRDERTAHMIEGIRAQLGK